MPIHDESVINTLKEKIETITNKIRKFLKFNSMIRTKKIERDLIV